MRLASIVRDRRGVAAVELALIAPVIAGVVLISFEIWRYATWAQEMRDAVKAGVNYYMTGGADDDDAEAIAQAAWTHAPAGASVEVNRACVCGTSVHACNTLCSNTTVPEVQVTVRARATYPESYFSQYLENEQVVRVR